MLLVYISEHSVLIDIPHCCVTYESLLTDFKNSLENLHISNSLSNK